MESVRESGEAAARRVRRPKDGRDIPRFYRTTNPARAPNSGVENTICPTGRIKGWHNVCRHRPFGPFQANKTFGASRPLGYTGKWEKRATYVVDTNLPDVQTYRMPHAISRKNGLFVLSLMLALGALSARANVLVYDSMSSLDPDPVNIAPGEAVFWTDGDGGGPYGIYARNGAWSTETDSSGIRFNQVGT